MELYNENTLSVIQPLTQIKIGDGRVFVMSHSPVSPLSFLLIDRLSYTVHIQQNDFLIEMYNRDFYFQRQKEQATQKYQAQLDEEDNRYFQFVKEVIQKYNEQICNETDKSKIDFLQNEKANMIVERGKQFTIRFNEIKEEFHTIRDNLSFEYEEFYSELYSRFRECGINDFIIPASHLF